MESLENAFVDLIVTFVEFLLCEVDETGGDGFVTHFLNVIVRS